MVVFRGPTRAIFRHFCSAALSRVHRRSRKFWSCESTIAREGADLCLLGVQFVLQHADARAQRTVLRQECGDGLLQLMAAGGAERFFPGLVQAEGISMKSSAWRCCVAVTWMLAWSMGHLLLG